jgi:hypothetical protein
MVCESPSNHRGNSNAATEAARSPTFFAKDLDPFEPYIAFMIDVEIVRNGLAYPLLHWYRPDLWVDIQSKDAILGNRTSAEASYVGPQPNIGPAHTYVLLLFRQPLNYKFPQCFQSILPLSEDARKGFDLHAFMEIAGLDDLVGANYFHSQNPDDGATTTSLSRPACAATMKLKNAATYSPRVDV